MKKRVVGYFLNSITFEEVKKKYEGYTDVIFSYWVTPSKIEGAARTIDTDKNILNFLKENNKKCILGVGGDGFDPLNSEYKDKAEDYGFKLAEYAISKEYDGINLDITAIDHSEEGIDWLIQATMAVYSYCLGLNKSIEISHAPQAPAFKKEKGYSRVEKETGGVISFYNVQYFNQGIWEYQKYENYESMFAKEYINEAGFKDTNPTAVPSIIDRGIPGSKIVVGKPITSNDTTYDGIEGEGSGYIKQEDLQDIFERANQDTNFTYGGVMGWKIDSDTNGEWGIAMSETMSTAVINS